MKNLINNVIIYFKRLFYAIIGRKFLNEDDLIATEEERFYAFLDSNKERIQYLMQFKSDPMGVTLKQKKDNEEFNEKLKNDLNLTSDSNYVYKKPTIISNKLRNHLNDLSKPDPVKKETSDLKKMFKKYKEINGLELKDFKNFENSFEKDHEHIIDILNNK